MDNQGLFQLLIELINQSSISGDEAGVCSFVEKFLTEQGFSPQRIPVDKDTFNILVEVGQPNVILQAHLDVVPPFIAASETDDEIRGRGSCDTKGSAACMIAAAIRAKQRGLTNFGLLFTMSEETDFSGAIAVVASGKKLPFVVVGEPSELLPVNQHYGISTVTLSVQGKAAHSSQPELGINAIDALVKILDENILPYATTPKTLMSVVKIKGGKADNIIPDSAEALISFRLAPGDNRDYAAAFNALLPENAQAVTDLNLASVSSPLPEKLNFLGEPQTVKYATELSFFQRGVIYGPGSIGVAHSDHEFVRKNDLIIAAQQYEKVIEVSQNGL